MDKIKINLDREKLSSEYIHSKQDFKQVQNQVSLQTNTFKNTWFYGTIGIASIATFVVITFSNSNQSKNETNSTLTKKTIINKKKETLVASNFTNVVLASVSAPIPRFQSAIMKKKESSIDLKNQIVGSKKEEIPKVEAVVDHLPPVIAKKKENTPISAPEKLNNFPQINGVYKGEITQSKLCGAGIVINSSVVVLNFTIQYSTNRGDKTLLVEGNKLPPSVCEEMKQYGIDQMIFITEIIGTDKIGKVLNFTSMNLMALID